MAYGQALSSTLPVVGVTAGTTAAGLINAFLAELQTVVEAKVTPAGLNMNADLSFLSGTTNYSITDLKKTAYARQSSLLSAASNPMTTFFGGTDGDLYVNDNAGRQVQITTGGVLNASTTGGITGAGYGAGSVAINWDAGTDYYQLKDGASTYAGVLADKVQVYNGTAGITVLATGAGASYSLTLPTAVPGSTSLVMMSAAGALSTSLTPSITTLTTSGLITAGGGVTASANQNVTLSGTGIYKHGNLVRATATPSYVPSSGTWVAPNATTGGWVATVAGDIIVPLPFSDNDTIVSVTVLFNRVGANNASFRVYRVGAASGPTAVGASWASTGGGWGTYTSTNPAGTVVSGQTYFVVISANNNSDEAGTTYVTLTR